MLTFNSLSWSNLLSTGKRPNTLEMDKGLATLIIGANGAGKSTILEALCFNLFGKPYRNVKKGQLVNTINKKKLLTESVITSGKKQYKIIRGIKPNKFEIWCDDHMINQESDVRVQQEFLESEILNLNYKTFTQIAVLGSANFVPFMQLPLGDRRSIIENILDIGVFSEMNADLKGILKGLEQEKTDAIHEFDIIKKEHELKVEFLTEKEGKATSKKADLETQKKNAEAKLKDAVDKIADIDAQIKAINLPAIQVDFDNISSKIQKLKSDIVLQNANITSSNETLKDNDLRIDELTKSRKEAYALIDDTSLGIDNCNWVPDDSLEIEKLEIEIRDLREENTIRTVRVKTAKTEIDFLDCNDVCGTCNQTIDEDFKSKELARLHEIVSVLTDAIDKDSATITNNKNAVSTLQKMKKEHDDLILAINQHKESIERLDKDLKSLSDKSAAIKSRIITYQELLDRAEADVKVLQNDLVALDYEPVKLKHDGLTQQRTPISNIEIRETAILKQVTAELDQLENAVDLTDTRKDIEKLDIKMRQMAKDIVTLNDELENHQLAGRLLKDDGIKTRIVRYYLPYINQTLNAYLELFDFPVSFIFDENFQETIKSRYRDDFSYASFSEGEKARINLSLMFTWRKIAMMKNRNATNILLFDEVFDSSLDGDGGDSFMDIIGDVKLNSDPIVISHKDSVTGQIGFDRIIEMYKDGGFSYMRDLT